MEEDQKIIKCKIEPEDLEDSYEDPLAPRLSDYKFVIEHCNRNGFAEIKLGNNEFCCDSVPKKEDVTFMNDLKRCDIEVTKNGEVNAPENKIVSCKSEVDDLDVQIPSKSEVDDLNELVPNKSEVDNLNQSLENVISEQESLKLIACRLCSFRASSREAVYEHEIAGHDSPGLMFFKPQSQVANKLGDLINSIHPLACSYCDFKTEQMIDLENHAKTFHNDLITFSCDKCDFKSSYKYALEKHEEKVHLRFIPYSCGICIFKSKSFLGLKNHMERSHGHLKPFICRYCNYRANISYAIIKHMEIKHSDILANNDYKHDFIDETIKFRDRYISSESHPIQQYCCKYCESSFFEKSAFYCHIRYVHKDEVRADSAIYDY